MENSVMLDWEDAEQHGRECHGEEARRPEEAAEVVRSREVEVQRDSEVLFGETDMCVDG